MKRDDASSRSLEGGGGRAGGVVTDDHLYYAAHHQAGHAVSALMLGYRVERVSLHESVVEEDWGILDACVDDLAAVCAAGFALERMLGRAPEEAWVRSKNDRALFAAIYADRTGLALENAELRQRFLQGAESSEAILRHPTVRKAIEAVAASLIAGFDSGQPGLSENDIQAIVAPTLGLPHGDREKIAVG